MEKKFVNPETLLTPRGYTHSVAVEGARKLVFIAGQVAVDKEGNLVGAGDLKVQIKRAAENLIAALAGVGAKPSDIVKMNTYIVNYKQSDYSAMREARAVLFPQVDPPASTLIGVQSLAVEGLLVEIEAIAALP
ncbi:MAG TPA: RidA family protein [Candidatus Binataceae bacterium]|nr:RidA family protein [Candidatus Binataceae bacterium]